MRPKLTLAKCQAHEVGIGVDNCNIMVLVDHYGDKPQHDGNYILCEEHEKMFMKKG